MILVVPAKAGTHNHRLRLLGKQATTTSHIDGPRSMGPGLRRDDVSKDLRGLNK
jgi:hypothetical protein